MSLPETRSSEGTAVDSTDLESGKKEMDVTVQSIDGRPKRPMLGRRRTTNGTPGAAVDDQKKVLEDEEGDALTKVGNFLWKIHNASILTRYILYVLPVALIFAIPLILFATAYKGTPEHSHRIQLAIFVWIEILWIGLWACKLFAKAVPFIFEAICGVVSTGIRKYTSVLTALEIPLSLLFWSILAYATIPIICDIDSAECASHGWPEEGNVKTGFEALIIVACIFLAEKTFIQLISINYHHKQYDMKIRESKKLIKRLDLLYDASRTLFPEFGHEFAEEDEDIQGASLADVRNTLKKAGMRSKVLNDVGRVRDKATAALGAMVSDVTGREILNATGAHSIVLEALETERASKALARRLWLSFVSEGKTELYKDDLVEVLGEARREEAEEIFAVLDRDSNGDVSLEEMTNLVVSVGEERKNRATSMHDISQAIAVLDRLLCVVVVAAIAFVYASFFSKAFEEKTTTLWTSFTGLAFAIGGTVTEFLSCCIFLFVKHPYDVGDRVDISSVELVCERISLMYSVFRRVDSDKTVQIPHSVCNTLWIENVSRSKPMKERLSLSVAATTSNEDILALRDELQKFVTADENRRDFQPTFDIELISVGDLQQLDLQVEIRHKSNFANELLRSSRRNKFMCELLASMRRIPIDPPGGSAPALGDPANPSYSVSVTNREASDARDKFASEVESKRLFPSGGHASSLVPDAITTALQNPAQAMIATISGRRGPESIQGTRKSSESMRISQDRSRGSVHGPVTYFPAPR